MGPQTSPGSSLPCETITVNHNVLAQSTPQTNIVPFNLCLHEIETDRGVEGLQLRSRLNMKSALQTLSHLVPHLTNARQSNNALIQGQVDEMLCNEVIEYITSSYNSLIVVVGKNDGTSQISINFRTLSSIIENLSSIQPLISTMI